MFLCAQREQYAVVCITEDRILEQTKFRVDFVKSSPELFYANDCKSGAYIQLTELSRTLLFNV